MHGYYSWFTFGLHLVRGPKALEIDLLRSWTMEFGPSNQTMENYHFPWSDLMVHGVNNPKWDMLWLNSGAMQPWG